MFSLPAARAPLENKKYVLQETPYLRNFRVALDQKIVKPVSYHNKERHLIMVKSIEQAVVPFLIVSSFQIIYTFFWTVTYGPCLDVK